MQVLTVILSCFLLLYSIFSNAQTNDILVKDSIDIDALYLDIHPVFDLDFYEKEYLDTIIDNVHKFYPTEKSKHLYQLAPALGQTTLPLEYLYNQSIQFENGYNLYPFYKLDLKSNPFYQNDAPYTFASYVLGGKEQVFEVKHAQSIAKPLDLAVQYRNISSDGTYPRQITSINNIGANLWFNMPKVPYQALVSYIWNRQNRQLNGGLIDDAFGDADFVQASADVYLNNAEERQIDRHLFFQQSFDFGDVRDSLNTTDSTYVEWLEPKWRIFHQFNLKNNERYYADNQTDSTYYQHFHTNNEATNDSLFLTKYHNKFGVSWLGKHNNKYLGIKGQLAVNHEMFKQIQKTTNDSTAQGYVMSNSGFWLSVNAKTDSFFVKNINLNANVNYGIGGWHSNTFSSRINANAKLNQFGFWGSLAFSSLHPTYNFIQFAGNHHVWQNNFSKVKSFKTQLGASFKKDLIAFNYSYINQANTVYLSESQLPIQSSKNLNVNSFKIMVNYTYKWLNIQSTNVFQIENHNEISLPLFVNQNQIFYNDRLFKGVLQLQGGIITLFNSSYNTPNFIADTGMFYYDNTSKLSTYPTFDLFVNLKIKRSTIFMRTYNLLQGITQNMQGMYAFPNHPLPDRSFKFGFSWAFYD